MFPQQITDLQQYRVPELVFAIPFVCNVTHDGTRFSRGLLLSLFFFYTYRFFYGRSRGRCLALVIFQTRPLFLVVHCF